MQQRDQEGMSQFSPVRMLEVELTEPPAGFSSCAPNGKVYQRARVLVRLHTEPLGVVEVSLQQDGISAQQLTAKILRELQTPIRRHFDRDGFSPAGPGSAEPSVEPESAGPSVERESAPPDLVELEWGRLPGADPICLKPRRDLLADPPPVAVIIATRERPVLLTKTLESLAGLAYPSYEVLVVDNAPSTEETRNVVARLAAAGAPLRYVREDVPGTSAARNRGMEETDAELLAFTDDDVVVDAHWLTALVEGFNAAAGVACVTGLVMPLELETPSQMWMEQYADYSSGFEPQIFDLAQHRSNRPLYPYNPGVFGSGQNMAFKRAALQALGGFDPALGPGTPACAGEELAVFFEIVRSGHRLAYRPGAIVHHLNRRDYEGLRAQVHGYGVGLTAYLTKCIVDHPGSLLDLMRKAPAGLSLTLDPGSPKHAKKESSFPEELSRVELKGMALGPPAYLRGRLRLVRRRALGAVRGTDFKATVVPRLRLAAGRLSRGPRAARRLAEARRLAPQALAGLSVPQESVATGRWGINWQRLTETGMAVLVLGPAAAEPAVVLKVAATPDAAAALKRQGAVAEALFHDSRLADWCSLLPLKLGSGEVCGKSYAVERALPGRPAVELLQEPSARPVLEAAALDAIGKLHSRTARVVAMDDHLLNSWVTGPVNALKKAGLSCGPVVRLGEELCSSLQDRRLAAGWIHGDFWPGNVLVRDLVVTGIIDWERAEAPQLATHDILHWLLYTRRLLGVGEIGEIVAGLLSGGKVSPGDRRFLDVAVQGSSSPLDQRQTLLLYWLRHVASNLIQSPAYARDVLWMRKVVNPVLEVV